MGALAPVLLLAAVLLARGGYRQSPSPVKPPPVRWEEPRALGQEVAPPWKGLEGGEGAVPPWAPTPAPVASATPSKDMRVKTPQQTPSPQEQPPKRKALGRTLKAAGVAACTALAGCPAAQVLPNPPGEPCPPGAVEAMEKLGLLWPRPIKAGELLGFQEEPSHYAVLRIFVRPGSATLEMDDPPFVRLSGKLLFGEGRVYGRFTEGQLKSGETLPVCYELYIVNTAWGNGITTPPQPGTPMLGEDGRPPGTVIRGPNGMDTARIVRGVYVRAVRRFE